MFIDFYGAAGEVTGSCNLVTAGKRKILVDCGMFQGSHFNENKNQEQLPFDPKSLEAVIVTHAHLDHTGRLPLLVKAGYSGFFYATPATIELAQLILEDALNIMQENNRRYGTPILYSSADVAGVMDQFRAVDYYEDYVLSQNKFSIFGKKEEKIIFKFYDAGHIFGSAFAEITIKGKKIVFSGDIGNVKMPIIRETDKLPKGVDLLVCESTYGNRVHEPSEERLEVIRRAFSVSVARGGVLMIPSFSLERTQDLLFILNELVEHRHSLPRAPIFLDSPLAIKATEIYKKYRQYYNEDAKNLADSGEDFFDFPGLVVTDTREASLKINHVPSPKVIIAGAGMMNGGRIQHHAMRYLSDKNSTLLIIGYQAEGTVGRKILDGDSSVKIFGQNIPVRCYVKAIGALSAHADKEKLLSWVQSAGVMPKKIFLNHGEPQASVVLKESIIKAGGVVEAVEKGMRAKF